MTAEQQWQHMWELQQLPRTPGTANPMTFNNSNSNSNKMPVTPRTRAFGDLEGGTQYQQPAYQQTAYQQPAPVAAPSWVQHAHGQMAPAAPNGIGAPSWYGGREEQGFQALQQVSPVQEREEYHSQGGYGEQLGKGKGVGFAH